MEGAFDGAQGAGGDGGAAHLQHQIDVLQQAIQALQQQVGALDGQVRDCDARLLQYQTKVEEERNRRQKNVMDHFAFKTLDHYAGKETEFLDWEFQIVNFVRHYDNFESYLEYAKDRETAVNINEQTKLKNL